MKHTLIRIISFLIAALMLLSTFACGKKEPAQLSKKPLVSEDPVTQPSTTDPAAITTEKIPEVTVPVTTEDPFPQRDPQELYPLYDGHNNVFNLTEKLFPDSAVVESEDTMVAHADYKDGILAVAVENVIEPWTEMSDGVVEYDFTVFDVTRGIILAQKKFEGSILGLKIIDSGEILVCYRPDKFEGGFRVNDITIELFNNDLTESVKTEKLHFGTLKILNNGTILMQAVSEDSESDKVVSVIADAHTPREPKAVLEGNLLYAEFIREEDDHYVLTYRDENWNDVVCYYNKETGEITNTKISGTYKVNYTERYVASLKNEGFFIYDVTNEDLYHVRREQGEYGVSSENFLIGASEDFILNCRNYYDSSIGYDSAYGREYFAFEVATGKITDSLSVTGTIDSLPRNYTENNEAVISNRYLNDGGGFRLEVLLWIVNTENDEGTAPGYHKLSISEIEKNIETIANDIMSKTNIVIQYDEESIAAIDCWDYKIAYAENRESVLNMVISLESVVEQFPEGFFDDIMYKGKTPLHVVLSGRIAPDSAGSIDNAAALAYTSSDKETYFIVFDAEYENSFRNNFSHEVMHIMDYKLSDYEFDNSDFKFTQYWNAVLNNGPYGYYYSYHDENGYNVSNTDGTMFGDGETYYVDAYSKTFMTEDKSRIFENLFCENDFYFEEGTPLRKKAEYLTALIRFIIPSVRDYDGILVWEKIVGKHTVDEYDFSLIYPEG